MQTTEMRTLSDAELDAVAAGATAILELANVFASGPGSADVSVTDVTVATAVTGGQVPSQQAGISGTITSVSEF